MTATASPLPGRQPRLSGKVAIVTGSTRGLGATIAAQLAEDGARVAITGRSADTGNQVVAAIQANGGEALWVPLDVTNESSVIDAVATIDRHWGRLDVVVNNAAATDAIEQGGDGRCEELELAAFDRIIQVGVHGAFLVTKHCIPLLRRSGGGSVVNISSVAGAAGVPHMCAYSASKGALDAMTRQWAQDLGGDAIRANSITVGFMASGPAQEAILEHPVLGPMFESATLLRRRGSAADVANAAAYLASAESAFVTGTRLVVDGGATARSGFPDADAVFLASAAP
ncbi:SDR family NAD(P)-dependent oxidoreductase [Mycobacterium vicinigordonae]|uniref:SDR family oxidoreductase n=1 Tax=Mycobacterium vicinigordonae TaxID=1719132 RepID=A0A7D6HUW5_9MYCO|nr:SDR family NAD(P)-dependent oxidoreductase [Mycobacterium vicinigordonae]QLL07373.1 SDR family oxidoreductase [Mycobacterium vicinigordonae]